MRMLRRSMLYLASAFALCFTSLGFASVLPDPHAVYAFAHAGLATQGAYGAECAKCKAELAHMVSMDSVRTSIGTGLTVESNGFRMASLTSREVAKGMTGGSGAAFTA